MWLFAFKFMDLLEFLLDPRQPFSFGDLFLPFCCCICSFLFVVFRNEETVLIGSDSLQVSPVVWILSPPTSLKMLLLKVPSDFFDANSDLLFSIITLPLCNIQLEGRISQVKKGGISERWNASSVLFRFYISRTYCTVDRRETNIC